MSQEQHPDPVDELHTERSHRVNTRRAALRQARDVFAAARQRGLAKRHAAKLRRLAENKDGPLGGQP